MQTGLVTSTTENQQRATTSSNGRGAALSWGVKKNGHSQLLFFHQKQNIRHGSSSAGSIVSETTSGGFRHPTETSNSNWRGQPELHKFVPKPNHAKEEQAH